MSYKPPIHGRDHCRRGSDPITCIGPWRFRARRKTTFQTLGSSGAETDLEWNFWESPDSEINPNIWMPVDSVGSEVTDPNTAIRAVVLLVPAFVVMSGCISIQALGAAADAQLVVIINDGYDNPEIQVHPKQVGGAGGDYLFNHSRSYPILDAVDNPDGEAAFSIDAAQTGGTDRNTQFGTYWELAAWPV